MLDLKQIIKDPKFVKDRLALRGFDISVIDEVTTLASTRSEVMTKLQALEADKNKYSKEIGALKSKGEDASAPMEKVSTIKANMESIKTTEQEVNDKIDNLLLYIPNIPSANTPDGKSEDDNVENVEHVIGRGKVQVAKSHHEIGVELDIVDFERAVKMAGARFWAYKGLGARLVRALENFMLDTHIEKGYVEMRPPVLVNAKTMRGTGQLPKFGDDLFKVEGEDLYLIPTAEVPLTNFYSNEIIDLTNPISLTAFTPCFRAEAGSGGKDMKGLIRAHQFNKVELVKLVTENQLRNEFDKTMDDVRDILNALELPYRELQLCTGDVGFSSEETIDFEVWIPSENKYREISSVSSFGNYQGRRAMIRHKDENGKNQYVYTINGSALAIDRTVAAILENYQNEDGTITVPAVLVKYMNTDVIK